jgi:hypothetical protein
MEDLFGDVSSHTRDTEIEAEKAQKKAAKQASIVAPAATAPTAQTAATAPAASGAQPASAPTGETPPGWDVGDTFADNATGGLARKLGAAIQAGQYYLPDSVRNSPYTAAITGRQGGSPTGSYDEAKSSLDAAAAKFAQEHPTADAVSRGAAGVALGALGPVAGPIALAARGGAKAINEGKGLKEVAQDAALEGGGAALGGQVAPLAKNLLPILSKAGGAFLGSHTPLPYVGATIGGGVGKAGGSALKRAIPNRLMQTTGQWGGSAAGSLGEGRDKD